MFSRKFIWTTRPTGHPASPEGVIFMGLDVIGPSLHPHKHASDEGLYNQAEGGAIEINVE